MKRSFGLRKTAYNLSESIQQHLNMYALAACAAGVSLLALPSDAKIVYTPAHIKIPLHGSCNLDFKHDGIVDFIILDGFNFGHANGLLARPARGNAVEGYLTSGLNSWASALTRGRRIGASQEFHGGTSVRMAEYIYNPLRHFWVRRGQWLNVNNRYLGLKFLIKGKVHYGWARLNVRLTPYTLDATLTGYAYETITGKSIKAGRTHSTAGDSHSEDFSSDASVTRPIDTPQPATLGMLATGAPGLSIWRREESERSQP